MQSLFQFGTQNLSYTFSLAILMVVRARLFYSLIDSV